MKHLRDLLNENLLLEKQTFAYTNYDEVVELAKNNASFKDVKSGWGSSGKAFELQLGTLNLIVDFANSSECLYMFVDNNKDELYCSEAIVARKVDWDKLFNDTKTWLVEKKHNLQDGLKYSTQKMKTVEKKYERSRTSDDFHRFDSWRRQCNGIQMAIERIDDLIKLYK